METIVAAFILTFILSAFIVLVFRNRKCRTGMEARVRYVPLFIIMDAAVVCADMFAGGDVGVRLVFDASLALIPVFFLVSSFLNAGQAFAISGFVMLIQALVILAYISSCFGMLALPSPEIFVCATGVVIAAGQLAFILSIFHRVRDVRAVLKAGSIWTGLSLWVDAVYVGIFSIIAIAYVLFWRISPLSCAVSLLFAAAVPAFCIRLSKGAVFVFLDRHERRIVESMKVSQMEIPNDGTRMDVIYKELYERVVEYFETDKPYLKGELTINDVVLAVYSNKVYISRAISQFTGRNFCQFVNYYRIMYAVDAFRENTELKVAELSELCGFNSVVSFSMAFRLFMNENPSDWCRKERFRLSSNKH